MKGFLGGLFVGAPLIGFLIFLTLGSQHEIRTQQERLYNQQLIEELEFDKQFLKQMGELDKTTESKIDNRLDKLSEKQKKIDAEWERQFESLGQQVDEMGDALGEADKEELSW